MKDERFNLMLSTADKAVLKRLAEAERMPAAAVVRRLVWAAAEEAQLVDVRAPAVQRSPELATC